MHCAFPSPSPPTIDSWWSVVFTYCIFFPPVLFLLYQAASAMRLFTLVFQPPTFPSAEKVWVSAAESVPQLTSLTWTDVFTGHCSCVKTVGVVGEDAPHYIDGGVFAQSQRRFTSEHCEKALLGLMLVAFPETSKGIRSQIMASLKKIGQCNKGWAVMATTRTTMVINDAGNSHNWTHWVTQCFKTLVY